MDIFAAIVEAKQNPCLPRSSIGEGAVFKPAAKTQKFVRRLGEIHINRSSCWMVATGEAPTQAFAARLLADGYHGLLVRSFAHGASDDNLNLVLWRWSDAAPCQLTLIDDEGRLSR